MINNIKLLKKELVAKNTMAFHFEKPANFEFIAGQFGDITLLSSDKTDEKGNTRALSFVSAPFESDLVFATRLRETAFKHSLKDLPLGTEIKLDSPYGGFRLHNNIETPAVFLIGGIGITPVRSIIAQATHDNSKHNITLLYSNKTAVDAAFAKELEMLASRNQNFKFVKVYSDVSEEMDSSERGHIDIDMLRHYVPNISLPIFYLAGPAVMVKAMREMLVKAGADEDNIRTEEFGGY